ncbi:MAG: hypothetical protein WBO24_16895, partial [Nitrospirales bacterium]
LPAVLGLVHRHRRGAARIVYGIRGVCGVARIGRPPGIDIIRARRGDRQAPVSLDSDCTLIFCVPSILSE